MGKSPAFQFYPKDWLTDLKVILMDYQERGVYLTLLCHDWLEDGITLDLIHHIAGPDISTLRIEGCFNQHPTKLGFLTNHRLTIEREKQSDWSQKSSYGGMKSGEIRKRIALSTKYTTKGGSKMVEPKGNIPIPSPVSDLHTPVYRNTPIPKFNPVGKKKFLDWVYLSQEQYDSVRAYYVERGCSPEDFQEAVRALDAWFENNQKMRLVRTDDAKTLKGWPLDEALKRRTNFNRLEKAKP